MCPVDLVGMLRPPNGFLVFRLYDAVWTGSPVVLHEEHTPLQSVRHDAATARQWRSREVLNLPLPNN